MQSGFATKQNGRSPIGRDPLVLSKQSNSDITLLAASSPNTGCPRIVGADTYYIVNSGVEDKEMFCKVNYTASETAAEIMLEVKVSTAEFPSYTRSQSKFNDKWRYKLTSENAVEDAEVKQVGSVNNTHFSSGTITEKTCIKVKQDENGEFIPTPPVTIIGKIKATNIKDHYLPTRVTVKITESCELFIKKAEITTPSSKKHHIISPFRVKADGTGNLKGQYLSIPTVKADGSEYGFPLRIEYSPADAKITDFKLAIVSRGQVIDETDNLLTNKVVAKDGVINIPNFIMPVLNKVEVNIGIISLSAQLKGTIEDKEVETERGDVNVKFKLDKQGEKNFTPLFLAENDISGRRYGQDIGHEKGDDNWATASTIDWLLQHGYYFNDISAQHITQRSSGRSILGHGSHSDGTHIDLRYVDENGGFTHIGKIEYNLKMLKAARDEVRAGGKKTEAQEKLVAWIKHNRITITLASLQARVIYVANGPLGKALIEGKYQADIPILNLPTPVGQPVKPLGKWLSIPKKIEKYKDHVNHWHIGLKK